MEDIFQPLSTSGEIAPDKVIETEVLIVGAGAAGARLGIELTENDTDCLVIGKRDHGDAHTVWAAGGINAALANRDPEDDWTIHAADTLNEGHHLNTPKSVETVTKEMPERIKELQDWGCEFDLYDGAIDQRYFGAQSFRRTCYVGDKTGRAILETLVSKAQEVGVPYQDNVMITKILSDGETTYGAVGFDMETGETLLFDTGAVVLGAGGYSAVYHRHSSRDLENNGDGIVLAFDAGATLENIEFVQFHPTGMIVPEEHDGWSGRLITEAVRGEGGRLFNTDGERFMEKYSPKQMELDARDIVARAIDTEVREGRGTENGGVYLDISHRSRSYIKQKLPRMYERCKEVGVDLAEEPVEVAPTAHYSMGGVRIDAETGETTVDNLYAVGETTAGVHGANRLGGNSLAETVALGKVVGDHLATTDTTPTTIPDQLQTKANSHLHTLQALATTENGITPQTIADEIRSVSESAGGIIRTHDQTQTGLETLSQIADKFTKPIATTSLTSVDFETLIDAVFMYHTAKLILQGAQSRTESRGAHYRSDYPEKDSSLKQKTVFKPEETDICTFEPAPGQVSDAVQQALDEEHELDYHHLE